MRTLYILIFFLIFFCVRSQHLMFFTPEKLKQLPSSETYNIIQDKKGAIWFSSEIGVCRYNGNNLKLYSKKEGLKEGACYGVCQNSKGDLLFGTSKNRILTYKNDSLITLLFS